MSQKVYLAGPDVFLRNAQDILSRKAAIAKAAGFEPLVPGDLEIPPAATRRERAMAISRCDEQMMDRADLAFVNLTPFRGISADAGTVFEVGYMCASGKPVFGYSNSGQTYVQRNADFYDGRIEQLSEHRWSAPDGTCVEDFEMGENLMIEAGILARTGVFVRRATAFEAIWSDLTSFEECVSAARDWLAQDRP